MAKKKGNNSFLFDDSTQDRQHPARRPAAEPASRAVRPALERPAARPVKVARAEQSGFVAEKRPSSRGRKQAEPDVLAFSRRSAEEHRRRELKQKQDEEYLISAPKKAGRGRKGQPAELAMTPTGKAERKAAPAPKLEVHPGGRSRSIAAEEKAARSVPAPAKEKARAECRIPAPPPREAVAERTKKVKKQKPPRKKANPKAILTFLIVVLLLGLLAFLGYKFIRADKVSVEGNSQISEDYILSISGIEKGEHIFAIDRDFVERSIETEPYLELLDVKYGFPNKLTLVVSERQAVACFEFRGVYVVTDATGYILETVENPSGLPVISGINVTEFALGANIRTDDTYKQEIMAQLLSALEEDGLAGTVAAIDLADVNSVSMSLDNSVTVVLGQADRLHEKLAWLKEILGVLAEEGRTGGTVDLSTVESPVYRPAPEPVGGSQLPGAADEEE
ncbi:MAG: FtsQ-type POTRA domain-containing protein [Christensenellaceae bacterium]|nr:FtsQ-type POTRA domain-containing protein [Christensenellaceae bacterium]